MQIDMDGLHAWMDDNKPIDLGYDELEAIMLATAQAAIQTAAAKGGLSPVEVIDQIRVGYGV